MSKYIKLEDAIDLARTGRLISNSNFESVCKALNSLPTIEVSEEELKGCDKVGKRFSEDAISREVAMDIVVSSTAEEMVEKMRNAPSVIPQQKEGEWYRQTTDHFDYWECSECGMGVGLDDIKNYCPNCGAKMKGAEE